MITIPTIKELTTSIISDIEATYGDTVPPFGKILLYALASVQAAKLKLYYLAIGHLQKNLFVDTATTEAQGGTLERFGRIKLGRNPYPATAGQYTVQVTGSIGAVIKASTSFKSDDDSTSPGKLFILDTEHTLAASPDTITLRALESGLSSKLSVNDTLSATAPIISVDSTATVQSESVEPLSAEDIELYRSRTEEAFRLEPQGGAAADYRLWAEDAQGVQQSYPYVKSGAISEINLFVEATEADSTDGKGTPSSTILDDVKSVVEFDPDTTKDISERGRKPLQVAVNYLPVTIKEIDIEITGFTGNTPAIETVIFDALKKELSTVRPFIDATDTLENKNNLFSVNKIISTILSARPGSVFTSVVLKVDTVAVVNYTFENGDIPHLNSVVYL